MKKIRRPAKNSGKHQIVVLLGIIIVAAVLFFNRSYFEVPALDFFNLLEEGKHYLAGRFPPSVHNPPLYPLILALLGAILPGIRPELNGGVIFNILMFLMLLYVTWRIGRNVAGQAWATVLTGLVAVTPLSWYLALQPLGTMVFVCFLVFSFFVWTETGISRWLYMLAGVSYYVKHEAVLLFAAIAVTEFLINKKNSRIWALLVWSILPAAAWEGIVAVSGGHNQYVREFFGLPRSFPNNEFLFNTFVRSPFAGQLAVYPAGAYVLSAVSVAGVGLMAVGKNIHMRALGLFTLFYTAVHLLLPGDARRYAFPLVWILYMAIITVFSGGFPLKTKLGPLVAAVCIIIGVTNLATLPSYMSEERYKGYEYKLAGDWMRELSPQRPTLLVMLVPWVARYYISNPLVTPYAVLDEYPTIACGIRYYTDRLPYDVLFVHESSVTQSAFERAYLQPFRDKWERFRRDKSEYLTLLRSFQDLNKEVLLYRFQWTKDRNGLCV
jgi:hypothetical protein